MSWNDLTESVCVRETGVINTNQLGTPPHTTNKLYTPCSKYDQCLNPSFEQILPRQFTERQREDGFAFANPHCRTTCLKN